MSDYEQFYKSRLKNTKMQGKEITGLCPFHDDKKKKFTANIESGMCQCWVCGFKGNAVSFLSKLDNITGAEAKQKVDEYLGIVKDIAKEQKKEKVKRAPETLESYATSKRLPVDYLKGRWHLSDAKMYSCECVAIPVFDENGNELIRRFRFGSKGDQRFAYQVKENNKEHKNNLYGLQFLDDIHDSKEVIIVEGESDTQTLDFLDFNALGVPGSSTINADMIKPLMDIEGLKIYLHQENDTAAAHFIDKAKKALKDADFKGSLYVFKCSDMGEKDPSDLYIKYGNDAKLKLQTLIEKAERTDINCIPVSVTGAPVNLRIPLGYKVDDTGIYAVNKDGAETIVSSTPFLISKKKISLNTNQEKIELFIKTDNRRFTELFNRSAIASTTNIIANLSDVGVNISSFNAKIMLAYLSKLESDNGDLIPATEYVTHLGWVDNKRFYPYCADKIELDCPDDNINSACELKGSLDAWCKLMQPHRERYIFRFMLASSFAAPLLRKFGVRTFVVYNWATSKSGKTTALKCALSVWGNPDKLKFQFDSTPNYIKSRSALVCDMPFAIDEKQQVNNKNIDLTKLFLDLGNETGRGRCTKSGAGQTTASWKNICITTGEEPLSLYNDGAENRYIEIKGAPFDSEEQINSIINNIGHNTGVAGQKYIKYIVENLADVVTDEKCKEYAKFKELVEQVKNINDFGDYNKSTMLAVIMYADMLASEIVFNESKEKAYADALNMIENIIADIKKNANMPVNVQACCYLFDYFQSNKHLYFSPDISNNTCKGFLHKGDLCLYKWAFDEILSAKNFNPGKTWNYLKDISIVKLDKQGQPALKKLSGRAQRMVIINYKEFLKLTGNEDDDRGVNLNDRADFMNDYVPVQ